MDINTLESIMIENRIADLDARLDYMLEHVLLPLAKILNDTTTALDWASTGLPQDGPIHDHGLRINLLDASTRILCLLKTLRHDVDHLHAEAEENQADDARLGAFIERSDQLQAYMARQEQLIKAGVQIPL